MSAAAHTLQTYYRRFRGLGLVRILLIIGAVFTIVAIANPLWSTTLDRGGGTYTTTSYGWTTVTRVGYENGVWMETLIQSYPATGFGLVENALSGSYLAAVVFVFVLFVVIALFSLEWIRRLPNLGLLIIGLVVVVFALVALFYPMLTVPSAAATDLARPAISSFWGSAAVPGGTYSWGAALGWWLLLVGAILGILGGLWPFLQALRNPVPRVPPPPPREWQVER